MLSTTQRFLIILRFATVFYCPAVILGQSQIKAKGYTKSHSSVKLSSIEGSEETSVRSEIECTVMCQIKKCTSAVYIESQLICQIYRPMESLLTGVTGTLNPRAAGKAWIADDVSQPQDTAIVFRNHSQGRIGKVQQALINFTGCYRIEVAGARGGSSSDMGRLGGYGAYVMGLFDLKNGTQLSIVVGQAGSRAKGYYAGTGGGGGSFVYRTVDNQLLVAAGGGGGASCCYHGTTGNNETQGRKSQGSSLIFGGMGGINGQGGINDPLSTPPLNTAGGCGAGWLGKPLIPRRNSSDGEGGGSLSEGWVGGKAGDGNSGDGGFGGGGGSGYGDYESYLTRGAAGAGGGYCGGGAGILGDHGGGGGGSYCGGIRCDSKAGGNGDSEQGYVFLRFVALSCG